MIDLERRPGAPEDDSGASEDADRPERSGVPDRDDLLVGFDPLNGHRPGDG